MASKSPLPPLAKVLHYFWNPSPSTDHNNYHCHDHRCKHQFGIVQIQTLLQSPHPTQLF